MQRTPKQGRKLKLSGKNGVNTRNKSEAASTPKVRENVDSPPWLSESASCESSAPSPIPFLCTQDGSNGENDVVWNYYSPTSEKNSPTYPIASDTPIRKRKKKFLYNDFSPVTRIPMKKKSMRPSLRKKEFLKGLKEELMALNKNVQGQIYSESVSSPVTSPDGDPVRQISPILDDCLFDNVLEPVTESDDKYGINTQVIPLKNNIFDKIAKCDNEGALESDDSMNEFLLQASQMVEEEHGGRRNMKVCDNLVKNKLSLGSGKIKNQQLTKVASPNLKNDSFDNLISDMNDSEIESLTQATRETANNLGKNNVGVGSKTSKHFIKSQNKSCDNNNYFPMTDRGKEIKNKSRVNNNFENTNWNDNSGDNIMNNISNLSNLMSCSMLNDSKSKFSRHRSMPESPTAPQNKKKKGNSASTSFTRHNTMPTHTTDLGTDGPLSQTMKCTPEEIRKKHQAARERLLARKQEPSSRKNSLSSIPSNPELDKIVTDTKLSTATSNSNDCHKIGNVATKHKENTSNNIKKKCINTNNNKVWSVSKNINTSDKSNIQEEIERKRKEALHKLQMKKTLGSIRK